jgi:hypothetical protein
MALLISRRLSGGRDRCMADRRGAHCGYQWRVIYRRLLQPSCTRPLCADPRSILFPDNVASFLCFDG